MGHSSHSTTNIHKTNIHEDIDRTTDLRKEIDNKDGMHNLSLGTVASNVDIQALQL